MDKTAILIPCYNEEKTIEKVVHDWTTALPNATIYVYDNNSTDSTAEIAEAAGAVVKFEHKQGKGNVVRSMFRDIDAECYIIVDGDDTYSASCAGIMENLVLNKGVDMVVGDRLSSSYFRENTRRFHSFGNRMVRWCVNAIFDSNVQDIMSGCRAFSRRFVKLCPILSKEFQVETEMTMFALDRNMNVVNLCVDYKEREVATDSKLRTIPDGFEVLRTMFDIAKDYKPMAFFSLVALLFLLLGFIFMAAASTFPALFTAYMFCIMAAIAFFSGMVMDSIHNKEKREFEFKLSEFENKK